jgi:elongation factor 1-beta
MRICGSIKLLIVVNNISTMAQVIVLLRVMPEDVNVDIQSLKKEILSKIKANIQEVPIAFGLIALNVTTIVEDKEGEVEKIEKALKEIKGVGEIEVLEVTRTL